MEKIDFKKQHDDDLNDERWLDKRKEVICYYGSTCVLCGRTKDIEVHHRKYRTHQDGTPIHLWEYDIHELAPLCSEHHSLYHFEHSRDNENIKDRKLRKFLDERLRDFISWNWTPWKMYERMSTWKFVTKEQVYEYLKKRGYIINIIEKHDEDIIKYIEDKLHIGIGIFEIICYISEFPYWTEHEAYKKVEELGYLDIPEIDTHISVDQFFRNMENRGLKESYIETHIGEKIDKPYHFEYDYIPRTKKNIHIAVSLKHYSSQSRCEVFECSPNVLQSFILSLASKKMYGDKLPRGFVYEEMSPELIKQYKNEVEHDGTEKKKVIHLRQEWKWRHIHSILDDMDY